MSNPFANVQVVERPTTSAPAPTERQIDYFRSLYQRKDRLGEVTFEEAVEQIKADGQWTKAFVSSLIDALKSLPDAERPAAVEPPEGFHVHGTEVFKVQRAVHGSGNLYAKVLRPGADGEKGTWEYVGRSVLKFLSEATILTLEKAQEYGHLYGICARCGATLTDEDSIRRGIGPVCATRF